MRLIDADRFKKFLQALCKAGAPYDEIIQLLDKEPTACDVEKIVEQLEKDTTCRVRLDGYIPKRKAIEIVKEGGV